MIQRGQVERAARAAIARAKGRGADEVTPDDLLIGALSEISRFGVAWIGPWAVDVRALERNGADGGGERGDRTDGAAPAPAYAAATVGLFEKAAAVAREDGAATVGLLHLLAAFTEVECEPMAQLRREHGFSDVEWRAELARSAVGSPAGMPGADEVASGGDVGRGPGGPEILSVDAAAGILDVHPQTVRNYIRSGKLPAYRLAGERYIRVLRKDLLALLERVPTDGSDEDEETT